MPAPFILLITPPPGYSREASQTQDWMRNGYTRGLVSYGGNRRIFRPQGDPLSSRVSDCLATPLALASSWKSRGAARRIVKDKGSRLIKPIETHRKRTDQCKELEDSNAAKQRSPGLCRDKARRRNHLQQFPFLRRPPTFGLQGF